MKWYFVAVFVATLAAVYAGITWWVPLAVFVFGPVPVLITGIVRSVRRNNMGWRLFEKNDEPMRWVQCKACEGLCSRVLLWNEKTHDTEWSVIPLHMRSVHAGANAMNNTGVANVVTCSVCTGMGGFWVPESAGKLEHVGGTWNRKLW
jgi:hypothetical protein